MMKLKWPLRKTQAAFIIYTAFTLLLLAGCRSVPENGPDCITLVSRETVYPSITLETYQDKAYPLIYHLVTIDLSDKTLSLTASPLPASEETEGSVKGETTLSFARRTNALVAVNATPFSMSDNKLRHITGEMKLSGLLIADGVQFSEPDPRYGVLGFTSDRKAFVLVSQGQPLPDKTTFVFGGFWVILKDGSHYGSYKALQDSRTAAGISGDGSTLFLLSVEGENSLSSRGLSYYDCAEILMAAGASDAVQLDGGSSTSLIINGENVLSYPSDRLVAGSFGFITDRPVY